ncbi:hypothetical protein MKX01_008008 [Papaver californicum]|nr:hypothetical protein MKX01_008008 [Papaver californicum]
MRKKVDNRIKTLIENGVRTTHRSFFVIVGDKYHNQIDDSFIVFIQSVKLEHCKYTDSERILGREFCICVLHDFEALTPNFLARTIETVKGGGLVVLLLRSLSSLTSLYSMVMDQLRRVLTSASYSLPSCKACVAMDDELNFFTDFITHQVDQTSSESKGTAYGDFPVGPIISNCNTLDQGKAVISFLDSILDKTLRIIVALLAARGRGKSAALRLAVAGAIAAGYSNIFVTAPVPENVKTLFEYHIDYDLVEGVSKSIVRINVYKHQRQTIQYIQPHEHEKLSQAELLVIDEAAAIPLPIVRSLFVPYLIFISSTVTGYEGIGRSLSLKLLRQLEEQSQNNRSSEGPLSGRFFKKGLIRKLLNRTLIQSLTEAIRYAPGDPVESWLHGLLRLDATNCDIYYVNRDALFSYHKDSELFLQRMMSLQLMADAPAHHLFNHLPDILCGRQSIPHGDEIPWKFSEQFRDTIFPSLSGARIVRIAVHPSAMKLDYGSIAVELLTRYYEGQLTSLDVIDAEKEVEETHPVSVTEAAEKVSLLEETIKPRSDLPHLLVHLTEHRPENSIMLKFAPFHICQTPNAVTSEHTCMVIKPLTNDDIETSGSDEWGFFSPLYPDFRRRFARLLGSSFKAMECKLAMSVLDPKINFTTSEPVAENGFRTSLKGVLASHDLNRLEAYTSRLVDFNMILDLLPILDRKYFREKIPVALSPVQASLLLCMGLQNQDLTLVEGQLKLNRSEILILLIKTMRKLYKYLNKVSAKEIESTLPCLKKVEMLPHSISLDDDLNAAAKQVRGKMKAESEGMLNPEFLQHYAIVDKEAAFEEALRNGSGKIGSGGRGIISLKSTKQKKKKEGKWEDSGDSRSSSSKKRIKDDSGSGLHKKKRNLD